MLADIFADIKKPVFRPYLNVGAQIDIPTGSFEEGRGGSMILNGGLSPVTAIVALPNNYKTGVSIYMDLRVLEWFRKSYHVFYDSENTFSPNRHVQQAMQYPGLADIDLLDCPTFRFTDKSVYDGNELFELYRVMLKAQEKDKKARYTTPFIDTRTGKLKEAIYPTVFTIDSFSGLDTKAVTEQLDKNDAGSSENNTVYMKSANAKTQIMRQVNALTARAGGYTIMTAHVGEHIKIDPYAPNIKQLTHLGNTLKVKDVCRNFTTLPHNMWFISKCTTALSSKKTTLYPISSEEEYLNDKDLNELVVVNLRGKNGPSGDPIVWIVSQRDGLLPHLSNYHFLKLNKYWGMDGNDRSHNLHIYPECKIGRTTVRGKLNEDHRLVNAMKITSDLLQLHQMKRNEFGHILCDAETLYNDIKAMGYNWDDILDARQHWCPVEEEDVQGVETYSIVDLLNMRAGRYVPFWFTKEQKEALKL